MSGEGEWKYEEEEEQAAEGRATGERAPASQLRVNHSFHFSVRSREKGGSEGKLEGSRWLCGGHRAGKADYWALAVTFGEEIWNMSYFSLRLCVHVAAEHIYEGEVMSLAAQRDCLFLCTFVDKCVNTRGVSTDGEHEPA